MSEDDVLLSRNMTYNPEDEGFVYIITNKGMHGLLKIGYTMRSPQQRAFEMYNTGSPYKFEVEYFIKAKNPYFIEQATHELLKQFNVGKEWFNCDIKTAIATIENCVKGDFTLGKQSIGADEYEKIQHERKLNELLYAQENIQKQHVQNVRNRYEAELRKLSDEASSKFMTYWGVATFVLVCIFFKPNGNIVANIIFSGIFGFFIAAILDNLAQSNAKKGNKATEINQQMQKEIDALITGIGYCGKCSKNVSYKRAEAIAWQGHRRMTCPDCKQPISL